MGQKVHPKAFRIGTVQSWGSRWFAKRQQVPALLKEDVQMRVYLTNLLKDAAVDRIEIERTANAITVVIHTAKPGLIIGRSGAGAEDLKKKLRDRFYRGRRVTLNLNIVELSRPGLSASIVMQGMIGELERRLPFRRVLKGTAERVEKAGAKGVKLEVAGRLNGAEIARTETLSRGSVPLQNLRADIDYAQSFARTVAGTIGVKVWIYRGEVFEKKAPVAVGAVAPKQA